MADTEFYRAFCSGCGLCHSVNGTELRMNEKGFLEPGLSDTSFQERFCPVSKENCAAVCGSDGIWGDLVRVRRGHSTDPLLREKASSGGAISEIASFLLEKKYVDEVIHTGADGPFSTSLFFSDTREKVIANAGSRYIQTSPLYDITRRMDSDKKYAFIGKPCDVSVLRRYLESENIGNVVYYISFFCAGIPSLKANHALVKTMGCDEEVESLTYRGNGWPGYTTVRSKGGKEYTMTYAEAWGHNLGRDKHKLCRLCMDGIGLNADIVCADAWYIKDGFPDFGEHEGRSIIITRSDKGESLIGEMEASGAIAVEDYADHEEEMKIIQKYQYERRSTMYDQVLALKIFRKKTPGYPAGSLKKYRKFSKSKAHRDIFKGTVKRICRGRYD